MLFLDINDSGFAQKFDAILSRGEESGREVEQTVLDIIADVRRRGDAAVLELTRRFDRLEAASVQELEVTAAEIEAAFAAVAAEDVAALLLGEVQRAVDRWLETYTQRAG